MIIVGFVLNRMNVAITGMEAWAGTSYFPTWMEIAITLSIVTGGFILFSLAAKYLPVFKHEEHAVQPTPMSEWAEELKIVSQMN